VKRVEGSGRVSPRIIIALSFAAVSIVGGCAPAPAPSPAVREDALTSDEVIEEYRAAARSAYAQGAFLREQGDLETAQAHFVEAVRLYPRDPDLRLALAEVQIELGRGGEAEQFLHAAVRRFGGSAREHLLLSKLALASGDAAAAHAGLDSALVRNPQSVEALQMRGRLSLGESNLEAAYHDLALADSLAPHDPATLFPLAETLARLRRDADAAATFRALLSLQPEDLGARRGLAETLRRTGRGAEAEALLLERPGVASEDLGPLEDAVGMQVRAGDLAAAARLLASRPLPPRLGALRARVLIQMDRLVAADSVLAALPPDPSLGTHLLRGDIAVRQGRNDDARVHYRAALDLQPDACAASASLALLAVQEVRRTASTSTELPWRVAARDSSLWTAADSLLRVASRRAGADSYRCHLLLGHAHMVRGSMREAARHLEVAHRLDPDNAEVMFDLAAAHQELGDFASALRWGREAIARDPEHAAALNFVGYILAERGLELGESETLVRRALAIDPDNAAYIDSLGWVLYQRGDYAGATAELERASQLTESRDPTILEHLGDTYLRRGNMAGALHAYTRAVAIPGGRDELRAKRARLATLLGAP